MTKEELIVKWNKEKLSLSIGELENLHVKYYTTKAIRNIGEKIISMFIEDLKSLPNEPKTVSNNECKKMDCSHNSIHKAYNIYQCKICGKLLQGK